MYRGNVKSTKFAVRNITYQNFKKSTLMTNYIYDITDRRKLTMYNRWIDEFNIT